MTKSNDTRNQGKAIPCNHTQLLNSRRDAYNVVENLLVFEDIGLEDYQTLKSVLDMLNERNVFSIGEGLQIALVDKANVLK